MQKRNKHHPTFPINSSARKIGRNRKKRAQIFVPKINFMQSQEALRSLFFLLLQENETISGPQKITQVLENPCGVRERKLQVNLF